MSPLNTIMTNVVMNNVVMSIVVMTNTVAPQAEGTLHWVPAKTGGANVHWPNACQFHNSVPALLSPFLGWVAYCFL